MPACILDIVCLVLETIFVRKKHAVREEFKAKIVSDINRPQRSWTRRGLLLVPLALVSGL